MYAEALNEAGAENQKFSSGLTLLENVPVWKE